MNTLRRYWAWPFTGLGLLFLTVTVTPLVPWWATRLAGPWHDPKGETVIVLAGSLQSSGPEQLPIVGHNSYLRSVYALRAWREGWVRQILVSGDPITAVAMQRYLIASGILPAAVLLDDRSRSTHDHPINCRRMLAPYPGPVVLLTSDYHMFRAHSVFRRAGMAVQPLPIPDIIKNSSSRLWRWQGFLQLIEESVKTVYYRYRGWM